MTTAPVQPADPDRQHLRVMCDVLTDVVSDLDKSPIDLTALRAHLLKRRDTVRDRLRSDRAAGRRRPVVLDPARLGGLMSRQGQPLTPVITSEVAPTDGLSSAQVWMPPRHASRAHVHHHTDVSVLVLQGTVITLWWDTDGAMHELPQDAGQHLLIPYGVPHAAINPHELPAIGAEFRSNPVFNADNELLPAYDVEVTAKMAAILGNT